MSILRIAPAPQGGIEVWDDRDPRPVYFAPHQIKTLVDGEKLTEDGAKSIDQVLTQRLADETADAAATKLDAALQAEFERRKQVAAAAGAKTEAAMLTAVFGVK